jgi:septal ring factor EnvC (AmiA/AmiB activator)
VTSGRHTGQSSYLLSVQALESQITELEAEASKLLKALDSLKESKAEADRAESKRAEETSKEIATQVGHRAKTTWSGADGMLGD